MNSEHTGLSNVLKKILGADYVSKFNLSGEFDDTALHIILSESMQALHFVSLLEEEFNIEFDDDDIDLDFFSGFDGITLLIRRYNSVHE